MLPRSMLSSLYLTSDVTFLGFSVYTSIWKYQPVIGLVYHESEIVYQCTSCSTDTRSISLLGVLSSHICNELVLNIS